jgi:hypothetical protein
MKTIKLTYRKKFHRLIELEELVEMLELSGLRYTLTPKVLEVVGEEQIVKVEVGHGSISK